MNAGVAIQRMRLSGDLSHKESFMHSLDSQTWSDEDSERIIFIKKISVSGHWWELAKKIAEQTNELSRSAAFDSSVQESPVVMFSRRADLVVDLIQQIETGQFRWYGNLWLQQHNISKQLLPLLKLNLADLPAVLKRLSRVGRLSHLLKKLSQAELKNLVEEMKYFLGVQVAPSASPFNKSNLSFDAEDERLVLAVQDLIKNNKIIFESPDKQLLVIEFLLLTTLWQKAPHKLKYSSEIQRLKNILIDRFHSPSNEVAVNEMERSLIDKISPSNFDRVDILSNHTTPLVSHQSVDFNSSVDSKDVSIDLMDLDIRIEHGGLFYLINGLNACGFSKRFEFQQNPWLSIYRLFKKITAHFELQWDTSLNQFFYCLLNCESKDLLELNLTEVEEKNLDGVLEQLITRYRSFDIWDAALIVLPCQLQVQGAYCDLYFDESHIRLPIRRAALDIDPGWQPWLGRVIKFHYGHFPALAQA